MVGFTKALLKRLEHKLRGDLASFELADGGAFYFNPGSGELFLHAAACIRADRAGRKRPDPPALLLALCKARDRRAAADKVATGRMFPYDRAALINDGRLVARSMVASPREDLSE